MRDYRLIDSDSHTLEPPHIWNTWLPKKFVDQAPQLGRFEFAADAAEETTRDLINEERTARGASALTPAQHRANYRSNL